MWGLTPSREIIFSVCFAFLLEGLEIDTMELLDFTFNSTNMTHFAYGVAANAVAVLLYGSTFVPVKRIETGDGETEHG